MLLVHAKVLAVEFVVRGGVQFPKNSPFTDEQLAAEDWEPFYAPVTPPNPEDCGCGDKEAATNA